MTAAHSHHGVPHQIKRDYDLFVEKSPPLVPTRNRLGITERINSSGQILNEIDCDELNEVVNNIDAGAFDTAAVCFINSYVNPVHESTAGKILKKLEIPVSLSSEIIPEFREYERISTTTVNSYLIPKVKDYMNSLNEKLGETDIKVMQSNGGV